MYHRRLTLLIDSEKIGFYGKLQMGCWLLLVLFQLLVPLWTGIVTGCAPRLCLLGPHAEVREMLLRCWATSAAAYGDDDDDDEEEYLLSTL